MGLCTVQLHLNYKLHAVMLEYDTVVRAYEMGVVESMKSFRVEYKT